MRYKRILIEYSKNYAAKIFHNSLDNEDSEYKSTFHWHSEYELIYVEKGEMIIRTPESQIVLGDNSLHLFNSEEVHAYPENIDNLQFTIVNISPAVIMPYYKNGNSLPSFVLPKEGTVAYRNLFYSMKMLNFCKSYDNSIEVLRVKSFLNNICYYLIKDCIDEDLEYMHGSVSDDFDCARNAINYMHINYKNKITLEEIARYVGMTPSHFSKYFKDKTEITFSVYLRNIRLKHALQELSQDGVTVREAAINNGFPNVNAFIISCKKRYNRTPLEMRDYNLAQ